MVGAGRSLDILKGGRLRGEESRPQAARVRVGGTHQGAPNRWIHANPSAGSVVAWRARVAAVHFTIVVRRRAIAGPVRPVHELLAPTWLSDRDAWDGEHTKTQRHQ